MDIRRKVGTAVLLVLLFWSGQELRGQGKFGFGVVAGEPSGLSWKYRIDQVHAVAGGVGFVPGDYLRVGVDFLWQSYFRGSSDFSAFYGPGIFVATGDRRVYLISEGRYDVLPDGGAFGVRMALGVNYTIPSSPVDLYFEMAPAVILSPPSAAAIDFGLGVRVFP